MGDTVLAACSSSVAFSWLHQEVALGEVRVWEEGKGPMLVFLLSLSPLSLSPSPSDGIYGSGSSSQGTGPLWFQLHDTTFVPSALGR